MNKWQALQEKYAHDAFHGNGHAYTQEAKIAELERLIGQQTVEIGFLPHSEFEQAYEKIYKMNRDKNQIIIP